MEAVRFVYALLLLCLPWSLCLMLLVPKSVPGRCALIAGYGMLCGLLGIPLLMRAFDALGFGLSYFGPVLIASLVMVLAAVLNQVRGGFSNNNTDERTAPWGFFAGGWVGFLQLLCIALIALRLLNLTVEVVLQPLFPWDATMHWATKARVWFAAGEILPFVENQQWLQLKDAQIFTDRHPAYPITIPLLQVWMNLALDSWHSSLMNLPWVLCYLSLGLMCYGQLRCAGAKQFSAVVFTYMLMSLPGLNSQVALAGYADIFLGACFAGAVMAFYNWSVTRQHWQGLLALVFALGCLLMKNEGLFWLLSFVPGLIVVLWPGRRGYWLIAGLVVLCLVLLWVFPRDFQVAGHTLAQLKLHFIPRAVLPMLASLFTHDNWHLLFYGVLLLVPASMVVSQEARKRLPGLIVVLGAALTLYATLFLFTRFSYGAVHYTAINRIGLHLTPALLFLVALSWLYLDKNSASRPPGNP